MPNRNAFVNSYPYFHAIRYKEAIERLSELIYAPTGWAPEYAYVMITLQHADDWTVNSLVGVMGFDSAQVTRMLRMLAGSQLIVLHSEPKTTRIEVTTAGEAFIAKANRCASRLQALAGSGNGESADRQLIAILDKATVRADAALKNFSVDDAMEEH